MLAGVIAYVVLSSLPMDAESRGFLLRGVHVLQPLLIMTMLLLAFCKVPAKNLRLCRWHVWLLLFQALLFVASALTLRFVENELLRVALETSLICFICPTATAASVVTGKLGGNVAQVTTYVMLSSLLAAILFPLFMPLMGTENTGSFVLVAGSIAAKVFPVLLLPLLAAELLRRFLPHLHVWLSARSGWAFRIWTFALALAIASATHGLVSSEASASIVLLIAAVSLFTCVVQFTFGRWVGKLFGTPLAAGQSLGQKNTVLAIWLAATFLTPVTAAAGGFYSIWHNVWNAWQLSKKGI